MASKNKSILVRETSSVSREFSYAIGNVSLKFSLRTDIKAQLKDFKELLEAALSDVSEELEKK